MTTPTSKDYVVHAAHVEFKTAQAVVVATGDTKKRAKAVNHSALMKLREAVAIDLKQGEVKKP